MFRRQQIRLLTIGLTAVLIASAQPAFCGRIGNEDVCNATADYFLGTEDYPQAIQSHQRLIAAHPNDALAHYHLGFAYGMTGGKSDELAEYRRAVDLGLRKWDLFLNLGRLYLENGDLPAAKNALIEATTLGPRHAEPYFNLGLVEERQGALSEAKAEILTSLRLDPDQPDARNMLGLLAAESGNRVQAEKIWSDLARTNPDFEPAVANLALLEGKPRETASEFSAIPTTFRTASNSHSR